MIEREIENGKEKFIEKRVRITRPLYKRMMHLAVEKELPLSRLLDEAISEYLEKHE